MTCNEKAAVMDLIRACKYAKNHLDACIAGRIRFSGKSASLPEINKALSKANKEFPHLYDSALL